MNNSDKLKERYEAIKISLISKFGTKYQDDLLSYFNDFELKNHYDNFIIIDTLVKMINRYGKVLFDKLITIDNDMFETMNNILESINNPRLVLNNCICLDRIISVTYETLIIDVLGLIRKHNINSLPILEDGKLIGLFRKKTLLDYYITNKEIIINKDFNLSTLYNVTNIDNNKIDIRFIKADTTIKKLYYSNKELFESNQIVSFYFITEDGSGDSKILGMITPYRISTFIK